MAAREQSADDVERGLRTDQGPGNGSLQQAPQDHAGPAGPHEGCRQGQSPPCANKTAAQRLMQLVSPCSGTSDMYGIAVGSLMDACRRGKWLDRKLCAALAALVFTVLLQMALVGLLWQAAASGNTQVKRPEPERLWLQVGHAHHMLCELRAYLKTKDFKLKLDEHDVTDPNAQCASLWPRTYPPKKKDCQDNDDGCKDQARFEEVQDCLRASSTDEIEAALKKPTCQHLLVDTDFTTVEYGWGLFNRHINTSFLADLNKSWLRGDSYAFDPSIFIICAFLALALVVHDEVTRAAQLCFVAASFVGITPPFFLDAPGAKPRLCSCHLQRPEHVPWLAACALLLLPFVQLLVAVAVLSIGGALFLLGDGQRDRAVIIINSIALTFILSLDNVMGKIFCARRVWAAEEEPVPRVKGSHTLGPGWRWAGVAYFALIGVLLLTETTLLAPQSSQHMLSFLAIATDPAARQAGFFNADFKPPWSETDETRPAGINDLLLASARLHAINWFLESVWFAYATGGFPGAALHTAGSLCDAGNNGCRNIPMTCQQAMGMLGVYVALTVAVIFLLHRQPLPTRNPAWPWALAALQTLITVVAQLQYGVPLSCPQNSEQAKRTHTPQAAGFHFVWVFFVLAWVGMFLAVPAWADCGKPQAVHPLPVSPAHGEDHGKHKRGRRGRRNAAPASERGSAPETEAPAAGGA